MTQKQQIAKLKDERREYKVMYETELLRRSALQRQLEQLGAILSPYII